LYLPTQSVFDFQNPFRKTRFVTRNHIKRSTTRHSHCAKTYSTMWNIVKNRMLALDAHSVTIGNSNFPFKTVPNEM